MVPYWDATQVEMYLDRRECTTNVIADIGFMVLLQDSAVGLMSGFPWKHQIVLEV